MISIKYRYTNAEYYLDQKFDSFDQYDTWLEGMGDKIVLVEFTRV